MSGLGAPQGGPSTGLNMSSSTDKSNVNEQPHLINTDKPTFNPEKNVSNIHEKFQPGKKDDNMMAENDPIKRQPKEWQQEGKKDII